MTTPGGTDSSKKKNPRTHHKTTGKKMSRGEGNGKIAAFFLSEIHMKKRNKQFFFPAPSKWRTKKEDVKN